MLMKLAPIFCIFSFFLFHCWIIFLTWKIQRPWESFLRRKWTWGCQRWELLSISSTFYTCIFCTEVFSLLRVWLWTKFRTKNACVKRWWNWHLLSRPNASKQPVDPNILWARISGNRDNGRPRSWESNSYLTWKK